VRDMHTNCSFCFYLRYISYISYIYLLSKIFQIQIIYIGLLSIIISPLRTEQNRNFICKDLYYIHHYTKHVIQLYTRDIQL